MMEGKEEKKPIKRNPAIVRFSKDHYFGLLLVWKIRKGFKSSVEPERISRYVIASFEEELVPHFRDEEVNLFVKLPLNNKMRIRAEDEHKKIYVLIGELRSDNTSKDTLVSFADLLEKHIRFEERELFNFLQENLSPAELEEIESADTGIKCDTGSSWNDKFWN